MRPTGRAQPGRVACIAVVVGVSLAAASPARAQLGLFKHGNKPKPAASGDTTAAALTTTSANGTMVTDSAKAVSGTVNTAAASVFPAATTDTTKHHHSLFGKAFHAVGQTSDKIHQKTGIDPKMVALDAATGGAASALQGKGGLGGGLSGALAKGALSSKLPGAGKAITSSSGTAGGLGGLAGIGGGASLVGSTMAGSMAGRMSSRGQSPSAANGAMPAATMPPAAMPPGSTTTVQPTGQAPGTPPR